jgi:hypothetical protein
LVGGGETTVNPRLRSLAVALLFVALTIAMTWPQARYLGSRVYDSDDPLLSIWRVSWIAHILPHSPPDLFNGNIFYPEPRTLAYSDAVLLQGFAGAPLIWLGVSRVATYNVLLLLSMALSGWAMWRYAMHLTENMGGSVLAGIVFAFVPYRFDHYQHLELEATIFMPLALLYFDRAMTRGARRDGWLAMMMFVAQLYSCIYYAVFLATAMAVVAGVVLWKQTPHSRRAFLSAIIPAAVVAGVLAAPYAITYTTNRETLGERDDRDVLLYSASIGNYLATPELNVVHGRWSRPFGQPERLLFPGVLAIALAIRGLRRIDHARLSILIIGVTGLFISFGLNTPIYDLLRAIAVPYRGLRAPARASILVFLAIAALAAFGWRRFMHRRPRRLVFVATLLMAGALLIEYSNRMEAWLTLPPQPPEVYRWLALQPRSVIAEVPFARADQLHSIADGMYMFNSTWHWQPIVNGYSGFFPQTFYELSDNMLWFPSDPSIAYLKSRGVDLIVLHGSLIEPEKFGEMTAALLARPDIEAMAQFEEPRGNDVVFRLKR